ncbi:MAG: shikimate kinase [Verrucomicrobiae bacterium]|nr:shikimate kinase [Verrucomicrobiae bacterium]
MKKMIVFGNSGSGKTTLAKEYAKRYGLVHLDLDSIAWKEDQPGVREDLETSVGILKDFMNGNRSWIVEGCYSTLIEIASTEADELVFMNPGIAVCRQNCRSRPWESEKYPSKEAQDANLGMLLDWVGQYETRNDEFSYSEHRRLFDEFPRLKTEVGANLDWRVT